MWRISLALQVGAMVLLPASVMAEGLILSGSSKSRKALFDAQSDLIDGKLAKQYSGSAKYRPDYEEGDAAGSEHVPDYAGSYQGEFLEMAKAAAAEHGVPEDLFLRLVQQESGWNAAAGLGEGGARLPQMIPRTARPLGGDIHEPQQKLNGGARYLRMMYDKFGSWKLALAAYNAGPAAVEQHDGVPPFAETENYVTAILG
ncbi:MAG TPA: lytic transglycosylase domain-containing protein [Tabrizicola sp.]|nr:lytic transglycosylase domain-containing protein [Tabrizicola sp.]